jgi:hypothetical protein
MDKEITFQLIKNVIIKQNEEFLKDIAQKLNMPSSVLLEKYIRPEYYLPICNNPPLPNNKSNKTDPLRKPTTDPRPF